MSRPPRIWMSGTALTKGDELRLRAQINHPMETGFRRDASGAEIPRNTLSRVEVLLNGAFVVEFLPETAISANPYFEFAFIPTEGGVVSLIWHDPKGEVARVDKEFTLS